jgi:acid phosphatase
MMTHTKFLLTFAAALPCATVSLTTAGPVPQPDHVVIVIMENHGYTQIIGNAAAPNINALGSEGALFANSSSDPNGSSTGSHGLWHPSQANYLELFSGNNQGVKADGRPGTASEPGSLPLPFNTPNLAASLIAAGFNCVSYSENLPSEGFDGDSYTSVPGKNQYQRKHNPIANWQAADAPANNHVPLSANKPFTDFPTDAAGYAALPTVSIVVPDEQHDMHDGTVAAGDTWLKTNIFDGYYQWAKTHNSILILTFDEDGDRNPSNQIPTIFAGALITPGVYFEENINPLDTRSGVGITPTGTAMNHYNVLRTVQQMYGVEPIGGAAGVPAVTDVFAAANVSFANISTRMITGAGDDVMIGGFIIGGNAPQRVIIRGMGPSLNTDENPLAGTLQNPVIELHKPDGSTETNDDWQDTQKAEIEQTGVAPTYDSESALIATLDPGVYTVILLGKGGTTGIGLVEVYALEAVGAPTLLNISTRGNVKTGNDVMIAGLIIQGSDYGRVLFCGRGPSLKANDAPLPGRLADPTLDLRDANGVRVDFNDDWQDSQAFQIERTTVAPTDPAEAAIVGNYPPGRYTVILSSADGNTGIGLVEAYRLN